MHRAWLVLMHLHLSGSDLTTLKLHDCLTKIRLLKWFMLHRTSPGQPPVIFTTKQKNYHAKAQKSQTTQKPSSPNCLKFSSFLSLFLLCFHCLILPSFSFPQVDFFSYWCLYEYSSTSDTSHKKRSVTTAEKVKGYNHKSMFFIQNRLILLFLTP